MKKKLVLALPCIAAVAFATFVGKKALEASAYEGNSLLMQNVEALSLDNNESIACPPNHVPNHYITATTNTIQVTCTKNGEIKVGEHTVSGAWEKNKTYVVVIVTKNCDGTECGACCDQSQVGVTIEKI